MNRITFCWLRRLVVGLGLLALLAACGGGGGAGGASTTPPTAGNNDAGSGAVTIALADAAGDFLSYTVDVVAIELRRSNGDVVQAVPVTTRVDFVELAELSELVSVATVPAGSYSQVRLVLDYANAEIVAQDATGNARTLAPRDASGNPLTRLDVTLELAERDRIVIARGVQHAFTIDFDLAASNVASFDPDIVTVTPLLVAVAELEAGRTHRLRGLLDAVDRAANTVTLDVRPHGAGSGRFGSATFAVTGATSYEIDGTAYTGDAGLAALAALADGTLVTASGTVSERRLTATQVLAGSSVPGAGLDIVHGVVVARDGDLLEVRGSHARRRGEQRFGTRTITVRIGTNTTVVSRLGDNALGTSALSVGSHLRAFGELTGSDSGRVLDATAGRVVLESSDVVGRVVDDSPLIVALAHIEGVRPAAFDFAGTGAVADDDSDPARYRVDTTGFAALRVAVNDVVRVRGRVADFGSAPPDFDALSLTILDRADPGAALTASWRASGGTRDAFPTLSATEIVLALGDARSELHIRGMRLGTSPAPVDALLPPEDGNGVYVLHQRGSGVRHYREFATFASALDAALDGSRRVVRLAAGGHYDRDARRLTARRIAVELVAR